jgi:PPK2 family polyphosphate:nucleotide phosphotransferase
MFVSPKNPYLVPYDASFQVADVSTAPPPDAPGKKACKAQLEMHIERMQDLQRMLYAQDKHALLLIFQAMDAAGKDSTIRAVMSGVNPAGCQVYSFKVPTAEELDHDFLWRSSKVLPERGRIGIFNRSYYEEVLVVRVHPEYLQAQKLPDPPDLNNLWQERYQSILDHEKHLAGNGTVILKFWLNISKEEQKSRFLSRIQEPHKNWKFSSKDVKECAFWNNYMVAYEDALNATSRPWAPWFAIPADDKPFMRLSVAQIIVKSLESLGLKYPRISAEERAKFSEMLKILQTE